MSWADPVVVFTKIPAHLQLYPRNSSGYGTAPVLGSIYTTGYESVSLLIYKDNSIWKSYNYDLYYRNGVAAFYFYPTIKAELSEYKFEVYANRTNDSSLVTMRDSIVCGDVYVINGQSNSHPSSSLERYSNEYCRTFGIQTGNSNYNVYSLSDTLWSLARGYYPNLTSVWGIQLQRLLVEREHVPICIINGGAGGSKIEEHMKDLTDPDFYTNSIYGKLLYRTEKAGVRDKIKAIFWYQGEGNATNLFPYYIDYFNRLYNDWKIDYPSVEKIYLFQINIGCTSDNNSGHFREGQRSLKYLLPDVETIATVGIHGFDGCHYDTSGYHQIARQVYKMVARDFYSSNDTINISSPDIVKAYYTSSLQKEIILEFGGVKDLVWPEDTLDKTLSDHLYLDGTPGNISSGTAGGNQLRLKVDGTQPFTRITYLPNAPPTGEIFQGPYIKNKNGVSTLSFFEFPVSPAPLIGEVNGCPGAFGPVKHVYGTSKSGVGETIHTNTTWYKDTLYILHHYVRVTSGAVLTIQPGTLIMGFPSPLDTTFLVVSKGSKINAVGTSSAPIVFTSCRLQGTRNYGDWGGIVICGDAPNNSGVNVFLNGSFGAQHGGLNADDNSGVLQYVRIEYAGMNVEQYAPVSALTLASVGRKTNLKNIQVSYSNNDSFEWLGGTVCGRYLISWKPLDDDFDVDNGYSGYNQFGLGFRDPDIASYRGSDGIESSNNINGTNALPKTSATFSNFECWGPVRSSTAPYNNFFKSGARLYNNTEFKLYNTLLVGWPSDSSKLQTSGIYIQGSSTVSNAIKDSLRIRNSLVASYPPMKRTLSTEPVSLWTPFNGSDDWFNKATYKNSTKGNILLDQKKAPFKVIPLFTTSSTSVSIASGSSFQTGGTHPLPVKSYPDGFQSVNYRGAFGGTDWTGSWTEFHPQLCVYTAGVSAKKSNEEFITVVSDSTNYRLIVFPNPTTQSTVSVFIEMEEEGNGRFLIYTFQGQLTKEINLALPKGFNKCELDLSGITKGLYILKAVTNKKTYQELLLID